MFWGLILEPYKRYTQTVQKSFHITNAALDVTTGDNDICQMMVGAQGKDFLICSLQKGKSVQTPLQLYFSEGSEISFTSSGKCVMHLTGFLDPENFLDEEEDDEESESDDAEESITASSLSKKDKKRKADSSLEENGTVKKSKNGQAGNKKQKIQADSSDDDDSDSDGDIAKLLQDDEDSDENDDTYIPNETSEVSIAASDDDEDEDDDDDGEEDDDDEDDDSEAEETITEVAPVADKKQKNKKDKAQQNGFVEKNNKSNKENEQQKNQQQKSDQNEKASLEKKVLAGNIAIEDLRVGQGQVAKQGKMLAVYYEGKLKSNNKTFDSCLKGPGFKFKLGKKEVIPGWEIGIAGMKVGGKRRLVVPPGMAYGKKGSPPVIPPNSTLVFDVELKNVN